MPCDEVWVCSIKFKLLLRFKDSLVSLSTLKELLKLVLYNIKGHGKIVIKVRKVRMCKGTVVAYLKLIFPHTREEIERRAKQPVPMSSLEPSISEERYH
jgi:hypothetical protein